MGRIAPLQWKKDPTTVLQDYERLHGSDNVGPLVLWARWAVESLYYLDQLDHAQAAYPHVVHGHDPDVVDIAHVRWASASAITSLDLCAAALGRACCSNVGTHEFDLRDFDPVSKRKPGRVAENRSRLPAPALRWVNSVLADPRYTWIQDARNPLVHSWLSRIISVGGPGGHPERTQFRLKASNATIGAREIVELSRDLATEHVQDFLIVLEAL